jgi:hypothetical protein
MPKTFPHQGMPALDTSGRALSVFEFWPMWAFYLPVFLYALFLMVRYRGMMLPTVANPSFPGGGFVGESKAKILELAIRHAPQWFAPFITVYRDHHLDADDVRRLLQRTCDALDRAGLTFPIVAKPDLGCRGAGVKLLQSAAELSQYIQQFPGEATFLLQQLVPFEGEAGVFYCRHPHEAQGRVISLTLKYFPYVVGDGRRTLRELILADQRAGKLSHLYFPRHAKRLEDIPFQGQAIRLAFAGSHSRGAIFRDGTSLVTPALQARFEEISRQIPEFYFGRFDIRFEDFTQVQAGHGFTVVEVNGAGAESTHIWDRNISLLQAWRDLMKQYTLLFQIGRANRDRGFRPLTWQELRHWHRREKRLTPLYPPTD